MKPIKPGIGAYTRRIGELEADLETAIAANRGYVPEWS